MSSLWTFVLTLAYCLPVLVLVVPLLARRYVGETALVRRARRPRPRYPRPAADPPSPRHTRRVRAPAGGALLSAPGAGRAPPLL